MANRDEDQRFQNMARALAVDSPRKTKIADSIDEGFDSLDVDPYLFSKNEDDDYNGDSRMYVRDYSRPGPGGFATEQSMSFWAPLNDLSDGEVDIRAYAGPLNGQQGTFTRATAASCRLKNGLLKKVLSGVPRSHYLASGAYGGYLAEGARTNLLLRSEEFDNASWSKVDVTVSANAIQDPTGVSGADRVLEGSAGTAAIFQNATVVDGGTYVATVFLRRGTHDWINVVLFNGGTGGYNSYFNLATGAVGSVGDGSSTLAAAGTNTIERWGDDWYRVSIPVTITGGTEIGISLQSATADGNGTRVSGSFYYVWGAQLEAGVFASSYIPTVGATATRNADALTYPGSGNVRPNEGTGYAEISATSTVVGTISPMMIRLGTNNGRVMYTSANEPDHIKMHDGTTTPDKIVSSIATGVRKRASSWGPAGMSVTGDGLEPFTTSSFDGGLDDGSVIEVMTNQMFGTIKNVRIWQRQLPDSHLQSLTA